MLSSVSFLISRSIKFYVLRSNGPGLDRKVKVRGSKGITDETGSVTGGPRGVYTTRERFGDS